MARSPSAHIIKVCGSRDIGRPPLSLLPVCLWRLELCTAPVASLHASSALLDSPSRTIAKISSSFYKLPWSRCLSQQQQSSNAEVGSWEQAMAVKDLTIFCFVAAAVVLVMWRTTLEVRTRKAIDCYKQRLWMAQTERSGLRCFRGRGNEGLELSGLLLWDLGEESGCLLPLS